MGIRCILLTVILIYGEKGYVYVLEKDKSIYAYGSQWVCYEPVIPKEIIEISVDDYLDTHCIISRISAYGI